MLNDAIKDRSICSSETLDLREGFFCAAMALRYRIQPAKFPNVDKSLGPEIAHRRERLAQAGRSTIKDLKDPFFRQVYGERSMYLSR